MGRPRAEVYLRADGRHEWRLFGGNGELICSTSQGYENKSDARASAQKVLTGYYSNAEIIEQ